jgi:hypothetical protein
MIIRTIEIELSEEAAELYDAALTGNDDDVILSVEKAVIGALYPDRINRPTRGVTMADVLIDVSTDSDLVWARPMEDA